VSFDVTVVTLFPEMFPGPLGHSLAGKALAAAHWSLDTVNPRQFGIGRHRQVDDTPAGGGPGMVMRADVLANAIDAAAKTDDTRPRLLMSARGRPLTQEDVRQYSSGSGLVIVCGRFEGVDERIVEARALREVSVGDYVLSGGESAAIVLLDAVIRLLPEVMGNACSADLESFENAMLEYPQFTRPQSFEGRPIPEILLSGNHEAIAEWRLEQARLATRKRRPDLLAAAEVEMNKKKC
jgi:tRNA (guanine37-N1)-methyltransferase